MLFLAALTLFAITFVLNTAAGDRAAALPKEGVSAVTPPVVRCAAAPAGTDEAPAAEAQGP